jgi:TP901 family phage tail tape measure protein
MAFTISYIYKAIDKFTAPLAKMAKEVDRLNARIAAATNRSAAAFLGVDKAAGRARSSVSALGKVNGQLQGMALNAERYAAAMRKVGSVKMPALRGFPSANRMGVRPGGAGLEGLVAAGGALGLSAGIMSAGRSAMNLESSLLDVERLSDLDAGGMAKFDQMTRRLSSSLAASRVELNQMAASAISAGVPLQDMEKFLNLTSMAAVAADFSSAAEAGEVLGTIQAQLRIGVDEMTRLGDQVNIVADRTNTTNQKMFNVLERSAGVISGWGTESQAAMAGFFSNLEPRAEKAATAMNAMVTKLKVMSGPIGKMMQQDGVKGLKMYFSALAKIEDPIKRQQILLKSFGQEHVDVASKAMNRIGELDGLLTMVSSNDAVGSLSREFRLSMSGMAGGAKKFKAAWENLKAAVFDRGVGAGFLRGLAIAVDKINAFTNANPALAKFITLAAAATAGTIALVGAAALLSVVAWPVWVVVGAMTAYAGALALAWDKSELFRGQVSKLVHEVSALFGVLGLTDGTVADLARTIGESLGETFSRLLLDVRVFVSRLTYLAKMWNAMREGRLSSIPSLWAGMKSAEGDMRTEFNYDRLSSKIAIPEFQMAMENSRFSAIEPPVVSNAAERAEAARAELVGGMPAYLAGGVPAGARFPSGLPAMAQAPMKLDVTVHTDPGTSATVNAASLPTGSNRPMTVRTIR